jgi:hypothetical protein
MLKFVNHKRGIIYRKRDKNNKRKRVNVVIVVSCVKTCCVLVFDDLIYLYISLIYRRLPHEVWSSRHTLVITIGEIDRYMLAIYQISRRCTKNSYVQKQNYIDSFVMEKYVLIATYHKAMMMY